MHERVKISRHVKNVSHHVATGDHESAPMDIKKNVDRMQF